MEDRKTLNVKVEPNEFWDDVKRRKTIKYVKEKTVLHLTEKEFSKCRFRITNQNWRMVECTVHTDQFSHGFRLFPPHLWDLKDGIIYKKVRGKFIVWKPKFSRNVKLLEKE